MIVSIWVFFMLGDANNADEHRTAYVQRTCGSFAHRRTPTAIEELCANDFHERYPGYTVTDSGWKRQSVEVMK